MLKKLKKYLSSLIFYKRKRDIIPDEISDEEKIVRSIFSPINIKKDKLQKNAFRPPVDSDEISVNRLNYTSADFCKKLGKESENPDARRSFFGLGLLYAKKIRDSEADVTYTPQPDNKYHADIKIGHVCKRGEPIPTEIQHKIFNLTKQAQLFIDPNPNSNKWEGEDVI